MIDEMGSFWLYSTGEAYNDEKGEVGSWWAFTFTTVD